MRKYLLFALAFFVLSTNSSFAIYTEETTTDAEPTATAREKSEDKKMMLMTATDERKTAREEAIAEMKKKTLEAREEYKAKMKEIRDSKKQEALTNLDERIAEKNKRLTDNMSIRLERISQILTKLSAKGALVADVAGATATIDAAKLAVVEQAAKDYVVEIATEETLRTQASVTIKEFMADIKAVHKKVVEAQLAVAKISKGLKPTEAVTPSPTITATP